MLKLITYHFFSFVKFSSYVYNLKHNFVNYIFQDMICSINKQEFKLEWLIKIGLCLNFGQNL